jgi:AraC family transcriptional activator of pobA
MERSAKNLYICNMGGSAIGIVNYNLFGEVHDLPDVMHCETIAARAPLHGWELAPHRHARLHQVLVIGRGGGVARLEDAEAPLTPPTLVNVPRGAAHAFSFAPESEGWVVTLASETFDESLAPQEGLRQVLAQAFAAPASPAVLATMQQILDEYVGRRFARAQVLRALCAALLGLAARASAERGGPRELRAESALARRFEALLEQRYREPWRVADYARALGVTATHLSRALRAATGLAAAELIRERVVREARRHLVYTNLPVSEISYALGFDDPAYFTRVFTAATGVSPRRFRARLVEPGAAGGQPPLTIRS